MDVVTANVVVTYGESINDPETKKRLNQDFRSRWGYITAEVFELYKKMSRGEMDAKDTDNRYIVFLPDGTLANVALAHMRVVDPFAVIELVRHEEIVSEPTTSVDAIVDNEIKKVVVPEVKSKIINTKGERQDN
jgi:hypothetical protein